MRSLPPEIGNRILMPIQTKATNADPRLSFWISRHVTQLIDSEFLETQNTPVSGASDCGVAVKHTHFGRLADAIYIAYVKNGVARVISSPAYEVMDRHTWIDTGFARSAEAVAIAFDGTMPRNVSGKYEFITEGEPWIFCLQSGAVYGQKLGGIPVTLATANATAIAAVRAMWSDVPGFDFGLVLFMLISGTVFYRQLISGVWSEAEPIPAAYLPAGKTLTQISAQRTWDFRIALQLVDSVGSMYELFTQFGGLGSKNAEHINVTNFEAIGKTTQVYYSNFKEDEHLEVTNVLQEKLYGGLYSLSIPKIVKAYNLPDENENYGKIAIFVFDVHINPDNVATQFSTFTIVDNRGIPYSPSSATLESDGKSVKLLFTDFNNARGECQAKYTPGTILTMAGFSMESTFKVFAPVGLIPSEIPVPKVVEVFNI